MNMENERFTGDRVSWFIGIDKDGKTFGEPIAIDNINSRIAETAKVEFEINDSLGCHRLMRLFRPKRIVSSLLEKLRTKYLDSEN
jgi:hypothetical protein